MESRLKASNVVKTLSLFLVIFMVVEIILLKKYIYIKLP